jgi:transcriptional regulator GlxA family with amidase domain
MGSAIQTCEILLAPGFVASELALVVDVLRIANRIAGIKVAR